MPRGVKNTNPVATSPVEPVETSTSSPGETNPEPDQTMYPSLQEALDRAEAAEIRAKQAEEALQATQKAQTQVVVNADIAQATGAQDAFSAEHDFYDKDGNELCWNCVNH